MTINLEKRKRIMQRSIKLGHCICDPEKPCPCDTFKIHNICLCAGERLTIPHGKVRLTKFAHSPGCASKIDQAFLKRALKDLPPVKDKRVLVGFPAGDDAGIYDLNNGKALVQTVDVFTPAVDDPYAFGQIAAANSLSDVYAMGAVPLTALSIIGFPARKLPDKVFARILKGGIDKMNEANTAVIGGHSIDDDEIKAGFAVTGIIDKNKIITNAAARPGDYLILTKPIGTGIISFAAQIGKSDKFALKAAAESMTQLNKKASEIMVKFNAHCCTDITGFGLFGHLTEMALKSMVDIEVFFDNIPLLQNVLEYAEKGILPGAIERNKESCGHLVKADHSIRQEYVDICFDAQTSGGLLIAISKKHMKKCLDALHNQGIKNAAAIGKVISRDKGFVYLKNI